MNPGIYIGVTRIKENPGMKAIMTVEYVGEGQEGPGVAVLGMAIRKPTEPGKRVPTWQVMTNTPPKRVTYVNGIRAAVEAITGPGVDPKARRG
jgi:hypothetical protein